MMTRLKTGRNKQPVHRVPSLAKALKVDPAYLLRRTLDQSVGATPAKAIVDILVIPATMNDQGWLIALVDIIQPSKAILLGKFGASRFKFQDSPLV